MPADDLPGLARGIHFRQHLLIAVRHAREVHHFAQANDAWPGQCFSYILRAQFRPGCLKTGRGWHAGWHLYPHVYRLPGSLVCHQFDAFKPKNVGNLMWVDEHAGGAMWQNRPHELGHGQHARFDMHMPVQQARHQVFPGCFNDASLFADGMCRVRADVGNPAILDRDIGLWHQLARLHAHPGAFAYHQVGRLPAHGYIY